MRIKKKYILTVFLTIFMISCSPFKERYFNKLSKFKQEKYKISEIDAEKHSTQKNDTLYLLNVGLLNKLISNSKNDFHIIYNININCLDYNLLKDLVERFKKIENLDFYIINGVDLVYKQKCMGLIYSLNSDIKYYILDPKIYGNIEGWHENRTSRLRIKKFYEDILSLNNLIDDSELSKIDDEYSPTILLLNKNNLPLYKTNSFCGEDSCKSKVNDIINQITDIIKN